MRPLERLEFLQQQIDTLLADLPRVDAQLPQRPALFAELAGFWAGRDRQGRSRRTRLCDLRRALMHAELDLRLADQTLGSDDADRLRNCLDLPAAWQRHHQPLAQRAQVYRPQLSCSRPNFRTLLPGMFVVMAGTEEGAELAPQQASGPALLCGLAQGVEAYASLGELHLELCERLDDPIQGRPLLQLLAEQPRIDQALQADQLRYLWYADDPLPAQIDSLIEAQRVMLGRAWSKAAATPDLGELESAMAIVQQAGTQALLEARYALLLEKNLPNWLRQAGDIGLSHIMQSMQRLVAAGNSVAAPGILTLSQFQQQHSLRQWAVARLQDQLRHDLGLTWPASDIHVDVVHTRQVGPHLNPFHPSSYITWRGLEKVGGELVEKVHERLPLDELALRNIAWFDFAYWLTARVGHRLGKPLPPGLNPDYIKALVRTLNVGGSYAQFLKAQLLDAPLGVRRLNAHAKVNRARMHAEMAKARYAGHLGASHGEAAYQWIRHTLDHPHDALRPALHGQRLRVRQLTLRNHTLQGVLLIAAEASPGHWFVLYTPDAPDRRAWRSVANTRALLRLVRQKPALLDYVVSRLPLLDTRQTRRLLLKGRLGPALRTPAVTEELFHAYYTAEVRGLIASADAASRTTAEADVQLAIDAGWRLLDLVSLALPARASIPLSLGRMAMEICDGAEALGNEDRDGVLLHVYNAMTHANDATTSFAATGLMRRLLRGMPTPPPLPVPPSYQIPAPLGHLRFRIDGVYGEEVYEQASQFEGLSQYFIRDSQQRHYKVVFDGHRWRVSDPQRPDAYLQQPVRQLANGDWVIDSPLLWYDGVPDLAGLLAGCLLPARQQGTPDPLIPGLYRHADGLYVQTAAGQLALRRHLLGGHFHLPIPGAAEAGVVPWALLRWQAGEWRMRVRQAGRSSAWLALPEAYSVSRGSTRSSR